jgi:SAM-dependent methyltransferase
MSAAESVLSELRASLDLQTAIDVGCGLGHFSGWLDSLGFRVMAVDGRTDNVEEARRRFPTLDFRTMNVEDASIHSVGQFDLVACFGLLYHLENPFLAIRNLSALTAKLLLVESVIFPGSEPIMALVDEAPGEDQGLNNIAFYPTENCLVKLMYRAGFAYVYKLDPMPKHPDFEPPGALRRVRSMLAASRRPLSSKLLTFAPEERISFQPYDAASGPKAPGVIESLRRYIAKP